MWFVFVILYLYSIHSPTYMVYRQIWQWLDREWSDADNMGTYGDGSYRWCTYFPMLYILHVLEKHAIIQCFVECMYVIWFTFSRFQDFMIFISYFMRFHLYDMTLESNMEFSLMRFISTYDIEQIYFSLFFFKFERKNDFEKLERKTCNCIYVFYRNVL